MNSSGIKEHLPWLAVCVAMLLVGGIIGYGLTAQAGAGRPERPTFYDYPALVLTDKETTSQLAAQLSYSTFHYRFSSNASEPYNATSEEMIIVDGEWLRTADYDKVVESCTFAVINGSAVIVLWHDYNFIDDIGKQLKIAYSNSSSYRHSTTVTTEKDAAGIHYPINGSSAFASWGGEPRDGNKFTVVNVVYEWGAKAMHEQWARRL